MSNKHNPHFSDWRTHDAITKLQILANFFPNLSSLSRATGISPGSLRVTLHNIAAGKNVKNVFNDTYKQAIAKARHKMTDQARKIDVKYKRGEYEAPVIRYSGGVIVPTRPAVFLTYANKEVSSFWVHYRVEHLPEPDQLEIARILFDWSSETGQFNDFRFEYIARADYYRETATGLTQGRRTWKDRNLQKQAKETNYVRLSTMHTPLLEISPSQNSDEFLDHVESEIRVLKGRGLVGVADWCFTWRSDYANWKPHKATKQKPQSKKWINKRGK